MRTLLRSFTAAILLTGLAGVAQGQDLRPPAEIAVGMSRMMPIPFDLQTDDLTQWQFDVRFTQPLSPRFALEAIGTVARRDSTYGTWTEGLYLIQIRQRLVRAERGRFKPFLTYGGVGYHAHFTHPAMDIRQPNGSVIHSKAYSYNHFEAPLLAGAGGGFQYELAAHAAVRADVQLVTLLYIPVGTRASVGVSIPFGRYTR